MLYPIGIQDFKKICSDGFFSVEITEFVYKLFHGR